MDSVHIIHMKFAANSMVTCEKTVKCTKSTSSEKTEDNMV